MLSLQHLEAHRDQMGNIAGGVGNDITAAPTATLSR